MSTPDQCPDQAVSMVDGVWSHDIGVRDRGLAYGDGLFETCRWVAGRLPLWSWHQARLLQDAKRLFMPVDPVLLLHQYNKFCAELIRQNLLEGAVKLIVTRGQGGAGYTPPAFAQVSIIWQYLPLSVSTHFEQQGLRLVRSRFPLSASGQLAGIKHLNRLEYVVAAAAQPLLPSEQLLLLDAQEYPIEALHQNIFWLKAGVLCTPDLASAGVAGVMRRIILERLAPALGLAVAEARFPLQALSQADEVFICNSLRGIWPVNQFDACSWSSWPVTQQLQLLEKALWRIA